MSETAQPQRCIECGQPAVVRIVYGMPGPETWDAVSRGEIELGGCVIMDDNPDFHCTSCGARWC